MADRRPPLTEETLRETKDDLVRRVTHQKRMGGVPNEPGLERDPMGGVREAETWLEPILRRVEIDHERERDRDIVRASEPVGDAEFVDTKDEVGTYDWNLRTDKVKARPGSWEAKNDARAKVRHFIRSLRTLPEWRARFEAISKLCAEHFTPHPHCARCHQREDGIRRLVAKGIAQFQVQKKLIVT